MFAQPARWTFASAASCLPTEASTSAGDALTGYYSWPLTATKINNFSLNERRLFIFVAKVKVKVEQHVHWNCQLISFNSENSFFLENPNVQAARSYLFARVSFGSSLTGNFWVAREREEEKFARPKLRDSSLLFAVAASCLFSIYL